MSQPGRIKQLIHNGVLIPTYEPRGFTIRYKGEKLSLMPERGSHGNTFGGFFLGNRGVKVPKNAPNRQNNRVIENIERRKNRILSVGGVPKWLKINMGDVDWG